MHSLAVQQRQPVLGAANDSDANAIVRKALSHELVNRGVAVDDEDMRVFHRLISEIGTVLVQERRGV